MLAHFYCGLSEFNPRLGTVDVKMWLYVVGATQLQVSVASLVWVRGSLRRATCRGPVGWK